MLSASTVRRGCYWPRLLPILSVVACTVLTVGSSLFAQEEVIGITVKGRVLDATDLSPLEGLLVQVPKKGRAPSATDGRYVLRFQGRRGTYKVQIGSSPETFPRTTFLTLGKRINRREHLTVLPRNKEFSMSFFNHVFRHLGTSWTRRWILEPTFKVITNKLRCVELPQAGQRCDELVATSESTPASYRNLVDSVIREDVRRFSGGALKGKKVVFERIVPGRRIDHGDFIYDYGTITVVSVIEPSGSSWAQNLVAIDGTILSGVIDVNSLALQSRHVVSHEIAHTLGYSHPAGYDAVPLPSIMRLDSGSVPTRHDVVHGTVLYLRPPGNRKPDKDRRPEEALGSSWGGRRGNARVEVVGVPVN